MIAVLDSGDREGLSPESPAGSKARHPSSGPRLPVETAAFAAMLRRMISAYARRVGAGDPEDLSAMLELRAHFDEAIDVAARGLHAQRDQFGRPAFSWTVIGRAVGMARQSARERWAHR